MTARAALPLLAIAALGGCAAVVPIPLGTTKQATVTGVPAARAELRDAAGAARGEALVGEMEGGLHVAVRVNGMQPGTYAVHLHAVGACEAPKFTSAGPHWNPTGRQHGKDNPAGAHKGDLPNVIVGSDGTGSISAHVHDSTVGTLLDADGASVVVHAGPDDYRTDPTGNSGDRIACGMLR